MPRVTSRRGDRNRRTSETNRRQGHLISMRLPSASSCGRGSNRRRHPISSSLPTAQSLDPRVHPSRSPDLDESSGGRFPASARRPGEVTRYRWTSETGPRRGHLISTERRSASSCRPREHRRGRSISTSLPSAESFNPRAHPSRSADMDESSGGRFLRSGGEASR